MNDEDVATNSEWLEAYCENRMPLGVSPQFDAWILKHQVLLDNVRAHLPELQRFTHDEDWCEDGVYRFYHHSFKVKKLRRVTDGMVSILQRLAPEGTQLNNEDFLQIIRDGTTAEMHNSAWLKTTRPILEAFFHAKYMIRMAIKYGTEYEKAPTPLPSGWATLLYLYGIR